MLANATHSTSVLASNAASEDSTPRSFTHAAEFLPRLTEFCTTPTEAELNYLQTTLDHYQEASYLLEPHLAILSDQPLQAFKASCLPSGSSSPDQSRISYFARYLYWLSKVVSDKLLVRYFPHSPDDLSLLLELLTSPSFASTTCWEYRYILLLWLSLVVSIPFSLDKFGHETNVIIEDAVIKQWLVSPGKERDATALLASKYFARKDVKQAGRLGGFLRWARTSLQSVEQEHKGASPQDVDVFLSTGILQTLCHLAKSTTRQEFSSPEGASLLAELYNFTALYDPKGVDSVVAQGNSPLLRRLRAKYEGRLAGAYLPPPRIRRGAQPQHTLLGQGRVNDSTISSTSFVQEGEYDVPEQVEVLISDLLELLSDPDSRVRWTTSKALARISSSLPDSYIDQIVTAIVEQYALNVVQVAKGKDTNLSLVSASTWHGCTLCLSSFLRSSLVTPAQLVNILPWILHALGFSQRKGAQKVGANVRDAACYFVWSLARAVSVKGGGSLISQKTVEDIVRKLVVVACTDEEVSVRRAASAAFQECVGRIPTIPHGLDVLLLLDSYIVGSRKQAFLSAAPSIARAYSFYRTALVEHLSKRTLHHADIVVRELTSRSLCSIEQGNDAEVVRMAMQQITILKETKELSKAHGSLLLLAEIAGSTDPGGGLHVKIFQSLGSLSPTLFTGAACPLLLPVIARVLSIALSSPSFEIDETEIDHTNCWRRFVDVGLKRPEITCHAAVATIFAATSAKFDCLSDLKNCLRTLKNTTSFIAQQCVTEALGSFDYSPSSTCNELLGIVVDRLSKIVKTTNVPSYKSIEAKRNALDSLGKICSRYVSDSKIDQTTILEALLEGMEDYTVDERGDVGSWVRLVCMHRLVDILLVLHERDRPTDPEIVDKVAALLLKQSAERIDNVRDAAGQQLLRLTPVKQVIGRTALEQWREISAVLPHLLPMLNIPEYAQILLSGVVITAGGPLDIVQPGTSIFLQWARELPSSSSTYDICKLLHDLNILAKMPGQSNRVLVPTLHTIATLLEDPACERKILEADQGSFDSIRAVAAHSAKKSKVPARILAGARILLDLLRIPTQRDAAAKDLLQAYEQASATTKESLRDTAARPEYDQHSRSIFGPLAEEQENERPDIVSV